MRAMSNAPTITAIAGLAVIWLLETWLPFVAGRQGRVRHALRNILLALVNLAAVTLFFAAATAGVATWAASGDFGLLRQIPAPPWLTLPLSILLIDCWMYLWHRANHEIRFLWRFHRVHHSDQSLDVTTALRFHTGEIIISSALRLLVIPLIGASLWQVLFYEALLLPVIQFHHSNVYIPHKADRVLNLLIASPFMHRVHHSRLRAETDSNYSSIFSMWDRLFGSFRYRRDVENIKFGLDEYDGERWQTVAGLFRTPFSGPAAARRVENSPPARSGPVARSAT
jgi:sterol desaturase/sphingolipid hydroxylase (fatty acid hydroxylase superfamily)